MSNFAYEIGDGWLPIATEAVKKIERIHKGHLEIPPSVTLAWFDTESDISFKEWYGASNITQVKEKYGGLRIYVKYNTDEIDEIIRKAEEQCSHTCEICGTDKDADEVKLRGNKWYSTHCKKCWEKTND
jgi:hypothetical protein